MLNLIQYKNHVDFDSKGSIISMQIEYYGRMSIDLNVDVKNADITDNKIFITFFAGTQINDTLFTYKGTLNIRQVTIFGRGRKLNANTKVVDQTFSRITDKWDKTHTNTWDSYRFKVNSSKDQKKSITYNYKGLKKKKTLRL